MRVSSRRDQRTYSTQKYIEDSGSGSQSTLADMERENRNA